MLVLPVIKPRTTNSIGKTSHLLAIITLGSANTTVANCQITPSGTQNLIFLDESAGAGGTSVSGIKFPKGLTIAGRWAKVIPDESTIVCYFGE